MLIQLTYNNRLTKSSPQNSVPSGQQHSPPNFVHLFAVHTKFLRQIGGNEGNDIMAGVGNASPGAPAHIQNGDTNADGIAQLSGLSMATPDELYEDLTDTEDIAVSNISDEDASSLIEPSISRVATRYKSPKTPAIEKALVMEDLEGGGFFEDPITPPATIPSEERLPPKSPKPVETVPIEVEIEQPLPAPGLLLGKLSSPKTTDPEIPITQWQAGPKQLQAQPQSSLQGIFSGRTRSSSGGAEALRKLLPKGLPTMAQVGNLFGSSSSPQKYKFGPSSTFPKEVNHSRPGRPGNSSASSGSSSPRFESIITSRPPPLARINTGAGPRRPGTIRRVTSDDSLLYHSLSRASSLGDDSRFENHREQVNSRVKAIRDSLQDRSSFRMPQMPSMPSMHRVSSFSFNRNFLNANTPARSRSNTDPMAGILPTNITKKRSSGIPNPTVGPAMTAAAIAKPEAAIESARTATSASNTDFLDRSLEPLTGDIVIMGGYRGSILRSTKTNRQLWVPVKVGLNIRKVDLEVGLEPEDEERMTDTIYASGMLQNIGPVDISKRLFKRLSECENARNGKLRVWDYGYDWRLSPYLLSRRLTQFLENLPSNQSGGIGALVIAHSLGGLITRHVVNHRPELFSGVIYAGVPKSCVNILGPLRNGDAVLLSSRVLTAQVNFTLRTSFVLLPEDGGCFFDINTKEKYPVDFFNIDDWIKYRWSPCTDPPLPPRNQPTGGLGSLLNMSGSLLNLPMTGKKPISGASSPKLDGRDVSGSSPTKSTRVADVLHNADPTHDRTLGMQMDNNTNPVSKGQSTNQSVSTTVTIPREKAIAYLRRTLAETKKFKQELYFNPELGNANLYPPLAVIYGKSIPTVFGAKVDGREGIPCSDSYDNLAFASGDGVCLAREAMLPEGYKAANGGRISSDRGHVTLLGDLNAVGRAIEAVCKGRAKGIGLGVDVGRSTA
jgi:hypothetical protein